MKHELIEDRYPLSPMQQGMLFHSLAASRSGIDIEQVIGKLPEAIDVSAFERAWQRAAARHAILRTGFHWNGSAEPVQEVRASVKIPFRSEDWRDLAVDEQEKAFATWLDADRLQGFELSRPPLARIALFRTGDTELQLVWTFHHLLLDARGIVLVLKEVFAFYEAFKRGEELDLPTPRAYREHIESLRELDRAAAENFWRQTLNGFATPTPLVVARVAGNETRGETSGEQTTLLSEEATAALYSLAQTNSLTLNTLTQGAWALLWHRYSGESDVVFGAVRAGRRSTMDGAESVAGLFINTVPVRTRFAPDRPLLEWLAELRARWTALRPFEHTPLVHIQSWSDVPRDQAFFEMLFNFHEQPWDAPLRALGGEWQNRAFSLRSQPNYPLTLDACGGDALQLKIIYDRRRLDDATIDRMLGHLRSLLEGFARNPTQRLADLPLLTAAERNELLVEWNQTAVEYPQDKCVHGLFAEQVARTPDALAVADEHQRLTYRELDERATELAGDLQVRGVGPEVCVAVCFERGVEMVVALLSVLKAGGAYVPLDPRTPKERLAFILQDAKTPVLLTQTKLQAQWQLNIPGCEVILDATRNTQHALRTGDDRPQATSANLAYVIYTSGSTGTPKPVSIEHRSLVNLITWHQRAYRVTPADRATQLASPAFDASVWEIWPYLTAGASVHIPNDEIVRWPAKLVAWLSAEKISLTFIPTPLAEALFEETWPDKLPLRAVLTGGDALHAPPPRSFPCALINHYGPTENTVVTTSETIPPSTENHLPPIGRPISNTQVYILDAQLQPTPVGVPGELHIGGDGLARGYLNRPELTAEKFIANPFSEKTEARLYKTGDLARWRADGRIEFLGRMDRQIKIRGHRIEPGEIESLLARHPAVREAAVVTEPRGDRLAAFVVRRTDAPLQQLREFLKSHLPEYMLPASFVFLDALPITPNGKVDRAALAAQAETRAETEFVAPRNPIEETLAEIWCEVLGVNRVGVYDNFFQLGGHSLLAARVVSRARDVLGREFALQALFDAPTIAALAEAISSARTGKSALILRRARNGTVPLSFAQERLWFLEQLEPGVAFNNIPLAFRLEGPLNPAALEAALGEIVRRHEPFRTTFRNQKGHPIAVREPAQMFTLATTDLFLLPKAERDSKARQLIIEEAKRPFDLAQTPLLRARLLRLSANENCLVLVTHHIACDGWSMDVFHRELAALYKAFADGRAPSLPELPVSYADFADWQRESLQADAVELDLAYWKQQLTGLSPLALPTDRPRTAVQTYKGATLPVELPAALANELTLLSRREGATLFMLLLAAFQTLLHRYSGQADVAVGSPIAGRSRVETESLIGLFLNTLVLRGDLSGDPAFSDFLKRTCQTVFDALAHQELPFEKIADALQAGRDLSRPPLFQAMFVLQNEPRQPLELSGLKVTPLPAHSDTAKFDLTLSLEETARGIVGSLEYNSDLFDESTIARMVGNFRALLEGIVAAPESRLSQLPVLTEAERNQLLIQWNETRVEFPAEKCIHELFAEQVARTPEFVAVACNDQELTYRELDERAELVAAELRALGVGPEVRVGICVERSLEMMIGLLGILKAGGCYVPLDPTYPKARLAFMLEDSQAAVLLTQEHLGADLNPTLPRLSLDAIRNTQHATRVGNEGPRITSANLAYVIYTSGSTGQPKGVMVTHRNVVNFFTAMDRVLGREPGVWLAVTSISFDISVLELFWTLTRGFKVVIHRDEDRQAPPVTRALEPERKTDFSLFYFASDAGEVRSERYRLLIEGAKFADEHGFAAVWTPERHFHAFGGLYPNPAVTSAALAMVTRRIQIRAGSVVLPLQHPVRIAEDWSVVDNLSNGRAAISIASGWHPNDFALAPENYLSRKEVMRERFDVIRRLWRGETIPLPNGAGQDVPVQLFPRPIQRELPAWLTSSGSPETFQLAGELGLNLLTHLSGQGIEQLAKKIELYRAAWREHGHGPRGGCVSLMLHTFVWNDAATACELVTGPLREYLRTYRGLSEKSSPRSNGANGDVDVMLNEAAQRYIANCGLFGTPESCVAMVEKLRAIGVDDIACLIDFGVPTETVLESFQYLDELRERCQSQPRRVVAAQPPLSIPQEVARYRVTHLQCTPSLAGALVLDPAANESLKSLKALLLGGEALPAALAQQLRRTLKGELFNMYGPTETTVWSATHHVAEAGKVIPIGRPIANTEIFILDAQLQPVPIGVPGELLIGGAGVARGYLGRSELTAEKFIRHPFSADANARLYRTGDLASYRADGTIEFLGRLDQQVKLRGHRIELGEIESVLRQHADVRECVVDAREVAPGDQRLVAYIVPSRRTDALGGELRRFLEPQLPSYMIPAAFVLLEKLPLTPNAKVDRKALPAPEQNRTASATTFVAPRTEMEKHIAKLWQELLRVETVGLHDNFFDLGGHSLLVVQAQARLREAFGVQLPVVRLFQHPTVSALARCLGDGAQKTSLKNIRDRGRRQRETFTQPQEYEVAA